jgi:FAD-dependent oxidoreductase domain-containing protein 1
MLTFCNSYVDLGLYAADYLRSAERNLSVPIEEAEEEFFNVPSVKYQPHGHLLLAREEDMPKLEQAHQVQKAVGAQTAIISKVGLEKRFPWLNTNGLGGGCLGLESEGWFDPWNLLQAVQLRNR